MPSRYPRSARDPRIDTSHDLNLEPLSNPISSCTAGGKPMPSITWFKNGVEMKNNKDQNQITVNTNKQKEQVQLSKNISHNTQQRNINTHDYQSQVHTK